MRNLTVIICICAATVTPLIVVVYIIKRVFFTDSANSQNNFSDYNKIQPGQVIDTVELTINGAYVGFLIGRGGERIRKIQNDANVRIKFRDNITPFQQSILDSNQSSDRVVVITGRPEFTELAKIMIEKMIDEKMNQERNMEIVFKIPENLCGKIIGRGGQNIRNLQTLSGATIKIDNTKPLVECYKNNKLFLRNCFISGTADQIRLASDLIEEIIEKEDERDRQHNRYRAQNRNSYPNQQFNYSANLMCPRQPNPIPLKNKMHANIPSNRRSSSLITERDRTCLVYFSSVVQSNLQTLPLNLSYFTVLISAVDRYGFVWVQLSDEDAHLLDKLIDKMTDRYCLMQAENPKNPTDSINMQMAEMSTTTTTTTTIVPTTNSNSYIIIPAETHSHDTITPITSNNDNNNNNNSNDNDDTCLPNSFILAKSDVINEGFSSAPICTDNIMSIQTQFMPHSPESNCSSSDFEIGRLCAAPHPDDNKYYRAVIDRIYESKRTVVLYFVDFGDTCALPIDSLRPLLEEFLQLPFQAVMCHLLNLDVDEPGLSDAAYTRLQDLTYCQQWKSLFALPDKSKVRLLPQSLTSSSAGMIYPHSTLGCPSIRLIDTHGPTDIDIIKTLFDENLIDKFDS